MTGCVHEMRLAETHAPVDEQGVVDLPGPLRHGVPRGHGQLVVAPHDETFEGVAFVEEQGGFSRLL